MSIPQLLVKYPLDLTGANPTNRVSNELHILDASKRAFVPNGGPFYTANAVVRNAVNGQVLTPVVQYLFLQPYDTAIERSGLEVCSVVFIKDSSINSVTIDYQVVGGEFSWTVYAIREMIDVLNLDERPISWGDVLGKPNAYPPTPHLHDLGDTYGWEYIAHQLEGLRSAILIGDEASHVELRNLFAVGLDELKLALQQLDVRYTSHSANTTNPHNTTKAQVGLGSVENYGIATQVEAQAGTANNKYMTPLRTAEAISALVGATMSSHISDVNNPHNTTKAQVGLGSVENYGIATQVESEAGAVNNKYMTPLRTAQAIKKQALDALTAHTALKNPHGTTATEVGAYSISQADTLLANKLDTTGTAVNSSKLENKTKEQVITETIGRLGNMASRNLHVYNRAPTEGEGNVGDIWFQY